MLKSVYKLFRFFIYEHRRLGLNGREFTMYKFRSMVSNSNDLLAHVEKIQGRDARGKIVNDLRLTSIGRLLKRYRIDEVPQIWNIICGDMSLVGPRPHSKRFSQNHIPEYVRERRLLVRPGILKPIMAFCDYDSGNLEWKTEEIFLREILSGHRFVRFKFFIRICAPLRYKWRLDPNGRIYSKKKDFYRKR